MIFAVALVCCYGEVNRGFAGIGVLAVTAGAGP